VTKTQKLRLSRATRRSLQVYQALLDPDVQEAIPDWRERQAGHLADARRTLDELTDAEWNERQWQERDRQERSS
jgi:hypothetical protein